jgi:hypothetical protein
MKKLLTNFLDFAVLQSGLLYLSIGFHLLLLAFSRNDQYAGFYILQIQLVYLFSLIVGYLILKRSGVNRLQIILHLLISVFLYNLNLNRNMLYILQNLMLRCQINDLVFYLTSGLIFTSIGSFLLKADPEEEEEQVIPYE